MIVIVCGTRKAYEDQARSDLEYKLDMLKLDHSKMTVIHGDCPNSPDMWAKEWAEGTDTNMECFPAIWDTPQGFDKEAGKDRNTTMAAYAAFAGVGRALTIAVWDGKSGGTLDMIKKSVRAGIPVDIIPARVA